VAVSCIFNLGIRWRWVDTFTPRPLYPQGKSPWYPLDRRLGGPQDTAVNGWPQQIQFNNKTYVILIKSNQWNYQFTFRKNSRTAISVINSCFDTQSLCKNKPLEHYKGTEVFQMQAVKLHVNESTLTVVPSDILYLHQT